MPHLRRAKPARSTAAARRYGLGALVALVALGAPASALGATTVGQTAPSSTAVSGGPSGGGPSGALFLNTAVAVGTPSYAVPAGGGVITSWSVQGWVLGDSQLEFKLVREVAANTFRIVGADPQQRTIPASTLASFDVRIPAAGGDLLALWVPAVGVHGFYYDGQAGDVWRFRGGISPEPGIGDDFVVDGTGGNRTNLSAQLEPDADADGFGDETQDECPTDASTQGQCPDTDPPETEITKTPSNKSEKPKAKYKFTSDEPNSTFECKLKGKGLKKSVKRFGDCDSPRKYKRLDEGKFKFKVRAVDAAGNVDPSPAKDKFKVVD
jgi:hypothetical protein